MAYRVYVTDCLRIISENTGAPATAYGGNGHYMTKRYVEIINPPPEETRTGEEIVESILSKLKKGGNTT